MRLEKRKKESAGLQSKGQETDRIRMENRMQDKWQVRLLGTRGSMATTGRAYESFGGDTLSVELTIGDIVIFLDAGTGIMHGRAGAKNHILIGHPHLDHLIGLSKWNELADPSKRMTIYMAEHEGMTCEEILHRLYGPPFWPVSLEMVSKGLRYVTLGSERGIMPKTAAFEIGGIRVETMKGNHPGGVTHFKLSDGKRTLVYAVDCELTKEAFPELKEFARNSDLLICDGQLLEEDSASKRGWGHSTASEAARLGEECGARQTVLVHYDPDSTDEILEELSESMAVEYPHCAFGRQGEVRFI